MAKEINFDNFGRYSVEQVLLGCCSLVADENTTALENRLILTEEFRELMNVLEMGSKEHRSVRNGIRERTDFF